LRLGCGWFHACFTSMLYLFILYSFIYSFIILVVSIASFVQRSRRRCSSVRRGRDAERGRCCTYNMLQYSTTRPSITPLSCSLPQAALYLSPAQSWHTEK
jgi:hypothetical protein